MKIISFVKEMDSSVTYTMTLDSKGFEKYLIEVSAQLQKDNVIPGFRSGMAPLSIAKNNFGERLFLQAALSAVQDYLAESCTCMGVTPISAPVLRSYEGNLSGLNADVWVQIYPEPTPFEYRGLTPVKPVVKVTEDEIDAEIDAYMRRHLFVHEVDRPASVGDIVELDFRGTCEGAGFDYDHSDKCRYVLQGDRLFYGLDAQLVGRSAGDEFSTTLTMPEDFYREAISGKTVDLWVRIRGVWTRELMECTDEFVAANVKGCCTVAEFRRMIEDRLSVRNEHNSSQIFRKNLSIELASLVDCAIPATLVETQLDYLVNLVRMVAEGKNLTVEELLNQEGSSVENFRSQNRSFAQMQVRLSVALDYIVRKEGLAATAAQIEQWYEREAGMRGVSIPALKCSISEEDVIDNITSNAALAIVRQTAIPKIIEVESLDFYGNLPDLEG